MEFLLGAGLLWWLSQQQKPAATPPIMAPGAATGAVLPITTIQNLVSGQSVGTQQQTKYATPYTYDPSTQTAWLSNTSATMVQAVWSAGAKYWFLPPGMGDPRGTSTAQAPLPILDSTTLWLLDVAKAKALGWDEPAPPAANGLYTVQEQQAMSGYGRYSRFNY